MNMHKLFVTILAIGLFGCTSDFDVTNTNPNAPTSVTPGLLLTNIIRNPVNSMMDHAWSYGNIVIQHNAKRQFVNEDRYLWGDVSGPWETCYSTLRDVKNMMSAAEELGQQNYVGIGLVMRSWISLQLTDLYGDVPFSQATQAATGIVAPSYDRQESIYTSILADLKKANSLIGSTTETVEGDILFAGNVQKWKRFANSLRVRMLLRISNKRNVASDLAEIVADPAGNPLFTGNADNAALTYLSAFPNQFPLHTARVGSFREFTLSKTLADTLLNLNDPRIAVYGRPTEESASSTTPVYAGLPNGLSDVDALNYGKNGRAISYVGTLWFEDAITPRGLKVARGVLMNYAELQFNLAEAAHRGLIPGVAKDFYEAGVRAAFEQVDTKVPDTYLEQAPVNLAAGEVLTKIATQKWIALYFNGMEAWADWRRTGLPALLPGASNLNGNRIPSRFAYPLSEQALNAANRSDAVAKQGPDDINTKLWWDAQ
jgi:hypothetical protein